MIEVIPGILEQDFKVIEQKVGLVKSLVPWIHIDVLDNTLIKNVTYNQWEAYKPISSQVNLEVHLMVADPAKYIEPMVKNGFKRVLAHVEGDTVREFLHQARSCEIEVGLAVDGPTAIASIEPFLSEVDGVLVMTITAGFSGQPFQPEKLFKIKHIHDGYPHLPIEVDGGINKTIAALVMENGATRLVVTSYLFKQNPQRLKEAIEELKGMC